MREVLTDFSEHARMCTVTTLYRQGFLLFRVVEIQRVEEATATPVTEGASLSEQSNNKGIDFELAASPLGLTFFMWQGTRFSVT